MLMAEAPTHHADSYPDQAPGNERMRADRLQWRSRIKGGHMTYPTLPQVREGWGNPACVQEYGLPRVHRHY
jgi:hypothetical protein